MKPDVPCLGTDEAIRRGDRVVWMQPIWVQDHRRFRFGARPKFKATGFEKFCGIVVRHSYGRKTGQHTFSIQLDSGELKLVKGRHLYPNILQHIVDPSSPDRRMPGESA